MEDPLEPERMQCMEVWGGNVRVEKHFRMPGLDAWVSSQPQGMAAAGGQHRRIVAGIDFKRGEFTFAKGSDLGASSKCSRSVRWRNRRRA